VVDAPVYHVPKALALCLVFLLATVVVDVVAAEKAVRVSSRDRWTSSDCWLENVDLRDGSDVDGFAAIFLLSSENVVAVAAECDVAVENDAHDYDQDDADHRRLFEGMY
jgi:hypothetical protein